MKAGVCVSYDTGQIPTCTIPVFIINYGGGRGGGGWGQNPPTQKWRATVNY